MIDAVDVFASGGGFTLGARQAGVRTIGRLTRKLGGGDYALAANNFLAAHVSPPEQWPIYDVPLVYGNPPCSGFSPRSPRRAIDAPVNDRMLELVDYAALVAPEVVIFESVQQAYSAGLPLMRELRDRLERRSGLSYTLTHVLHNALSHGGLAMRKRYFWVAHRIPFGVELGTVTRGGQPYALDVVPVLNDALVDLAGLPLTMAPQHVNERPTTRWAINEVRRGNIVDGHDIHHTPTTERIRELLESGHEWAPGQRASNSGFATSRWRGDQPAKVATRDVAVEAIHPFLPRTFTFREIARIMGFPDNWSVAGSFGTPHFNRGLGQGIPVQSGRWIAYWAAQSIEGAPGSISGQLVGDREFLINTTDDWRGLPSRHA